MSSSSSSVVEQPSLLWTVLPPLLMVATYFVRKWYVDRQLRVYGIGKGAPGFQTGVRQVRIPPELAERIKRGETVSPEEIAAATKKIEERERRSKSGEASSQNGPVPDTGKKHDPYAHLRDLQERDDRALSHSSGERTKSGSGAGVDNEWLPESVTAPKKRGKGKRK